MDESVRIGGEIAAKVRKLAEQEGRTIKSQIERLVLGAINKGVK